MKSCFVHIPKTAGSSLRTLITLNYRPEEVISIYGDFRETLAQCAAQHNVLDQCRLIQGHMPFGIHLNFGLHAAKYFFFLRNPVDRHFSDVIHGLRDSTHGFHSLITSPENKNPAKWAMLPDQAIYFRNTTTHYLSGVFFTREVDMSDFQRAASAVIGSEFVGLAERFNESVLILAKKLHWSHVIYETRNVATGSLNSLLLPEDRKACENRLPYDMALYHIACERLDREARSHGSLLREAADQLEELVAMQSKAFPELDHGRYLVGEPVCTSELNRTFTQNSPLGRWFRTGNKDHSSLSPHFSLA